MNREQLLKATVFAAQAIQGKVSAPILECLRLKSSAHSGVLEITGSNGDFYATATLKEFDEIDFCVPASRFKTILSQIPDDEITLEESGDNLIIRGESGRRGTVQAQSSEHYPEFAALDGPRISFKGDDFASVISAASTDQSRSLLQCVLLSPDGHIYAADGHRIHCVKSEAVASPALVPVNIAKLLSGESGELVVSDRQFMATGDGWEMGGKLIEGQYPDIAKAIPASAREIKVSSDFESAIRRAAACISSPTNRRVNIEKNLIWSGLNRDEPDYSDPVEIDLGEVLAINPDYLLDAIKAAGAGACITALEHNCIKVESSDFCATIFRMRV